MTRLELINLIGDVLTNLDVLRGSLPANTPDRIALDDLRLLLDDRQRKLAQREFDDNTDAVRRASGKIETVNGDLQVTIRDVAHLKETITNVKRFIRVTDELMKVALPFL